MPAAVEELGIPWAPVNLVLDGACRCEVDKKSTTLGAGTHVADVTTATRPTWSRPGARAVSAHFPASRVAKPQFSDPPAPRHAEDEPSQVLGVAVSPTGPEAGDIFVTILSDDTVLVIS